MFRCLDATAAKSFGADLAALYVSMTDAGKGTETKGSADTVARRQAIAVRALHQRLDAFRAKEPLNIYKKAALARSFKSALIEAGGDAAEAGELSIDILKRLSLK